uniref:G-protein coupled receptors family 1 profile domain-containing protein n=1 Tax=Setaria digitata TaxID=48799 RepID=A0A915PPE3_9BILA
MEFDISGHFTVNTSIVNETLLVLDQGNISLHHQITLIACKIMLIICILGITGNIVNLIILTSEKLQSVSYMYLRALAVTDLFSMIFALPMVADDIMESTEIILNQWYIYGFYQTYLMLLLPNWTLTAGVLLVVALSVDRFIAVVLPLHFSAWNTPQRALKIIIGACLVPGILYLPYEPTRYAVEERTNQQGIKIYARTDSRISKTLLWQVYSWTCEGLLRFTPILVLLLLNIRIIMTLRRRQELNTSSRRTKIKNTVGGSIRKDDKFLYILGGIMIMFFICNIPSALNQILINETMRQRLDYHIFRAVSNSLELINHASQFYILCACGSDYRTAFLEKFPCFTVHQKCKNNTYNSGYTKSLTVREKVQKDLPNIANNVSVNNV